MSVNSPPPTRGAFRFALPPSLGSAQVRERAEKLGAFLQSALGKPVEITVAASYEVMAKELLSGKLDAAWAPPFVCARTEAMGVRVLVRGVRLGMSSYRSALVESFAADPLFENVSPDRAQSFVSESVAALATEGLPQRLQVLAHGLSTHQQRVKAYRLATKIAHASGHASPAEQRILDLLQATFGLADDEVSRMDRGAGA